MVDSYGNELKDKTTTVSFHKEPKLEKQIFIAIN